VLWLQIHNRGSQKSDTAAASGRKLYLPFLLVGLGTFRFAFVCTCLVILNCTKLLWLALRLLFLFLISNQELLDCWVLIQEHRCNGSKACSHPVHNNVLNQCVASTAILEWGGQYWIEVATWVLKCYNKNICAKLHFIVMMCKKVYHASSKVTEHRSFSCVKCTRFRSGCGAAKNL